MKYVSTYNDDRRLPVWKAVNTLLLALDRLGRQPNVMMFFTSNLVQAMVVYPRPL